VVFVQYGDYSETVHRFAQGGEETYNSQRYSVEHAASLTAGGDVTVICLPAPGPDEMLPNGVRAIGLGAYRRSKSARLCLALEKLRPTHLLVLTPHVPALVWGLTRGVEVLPILADSFQDKMTVRQRYERALLVKLLNSERIRFVANHNIPSCLDLVKIGVAREKILPWDWPAKNRPEDLPPKPFPDPASPLKLFFAGLVTEAKGVGDLIRATALVRDAGRAVALTIAGEGDRPAFERLAASLDVASAVKFVGRIPQSQVFGSMREHDLVVVPSRHEYPEGLPMTISEGLASRTPLLVSDHPMIARALAGKPGVTMFRASSADDLARAVLGLAGSRDLYEEASRRSAEAWDGIQVPLKRNELIDRWLDTSPEANAALKRHVLSA
jgi:glycosyltransferase involved in cell wall biosynthesis